jgi:hypothetical protein
MISCDSKERSLDKWYPTSPAPAIIIFIYILLIEHFNKQNKQL